MESVEVAARLTQLRDKAERGEKLTDEEQKEAIMLVRGERKSAAIVSKTSRTKSANTAASGAETLAKIAALLGKKS